MIPIREQHFTMRMPLVNYLFIAINIFVFFLELSSGFTDQMFIDFSMIPAVFMNQPIRQSYRLLSSMFMHGGIGHIVGNMLFLWIFGDNIEDVFGHFRYFIFYLLAGITGGLLQTMLNPHSIIPMVGASGAISGVITAYALLFPNVKISVWMFFMFVIQLPAFIFVGIWIFIQLISGFGSLATIGETGGTAYFAHIGGILFGLIFTLTWGKDLKRKWLIQLQKKTNF